MKLSNLAIVFLVLAIMVIMVLTKYISLQIETTENQANYDSKLIDSTKEAIDAFEINSVQWNSNYSTVSDEKRRNVMAAINSFTQSFANNLGVGGTSKEYILSYIPAVAFTMHDGFYIYTPAQEKEVIKDKNGVRVIMDDKSISNMKDNINNAYVLNSDDKGKILYKWDPNNEANDTADGTYNDGFNTNVKFTLNSNAALEGDYKHVLKPFISYTEQAVTTYNNAPVFISYSLDNYVTVYYKNASGANGKYEKKSGYLIDISKSNINFNETSSLKLIFNNREIIREMLTENVTYLDDDNKYKTETYYYVYAEDKTKVYTKFSSNSSTTDEAFILDTNLRKIKIGEGIATKYKKVLVPTTISTENTYKTIYQDLATGNWYESDKQTPIELTYTLNNKYGVKRAKAYDYSATNYYIEAYCFTNWFNSLNLQANTMQYGNTNPIESNISLIVNSSNDPESEDSNFTKHKKAVIKYVIESNLNQAITSYSRNKEGTFKLPKLTDIEWEQIFRNVSIITFAQNIPIGLKYYNNYAIATSTTNKEYVDPEEIYLYSEDKDGSGNIINVEYHKIYCNELTSTTNLIGYRNIDFIIKSYEDEYATNENEKIKYYTMHDENQADYNCLIERTKYTPLADTETTKRKAQETAYYKALARERYALKETSL